jgi:CheY-like chemotaxis protein
LQTSTLSHSLTPAFLSGLAVEGVRTMPHNILIVDDEAPVRDVLKHKLEQCGYDVCEAADGNEAIRALESVSFDLVITDIIMPEKDGIETICFLRAKQPDVKVIAISAPSNQLFLESAYGLGAARVFNKPLKLAELAQAVEELLS